ncbi:signal peptidase I [Streptomyces sp. NPDC059578]|uniref:signal peptidase I n=1 Tax=Streptomyces sp. NPDC059578 TaxID=3346874 RepID=UPI00369490CD
MGSRRRPRSGPGADPRLPTGTRPTGPPGRAERRKLARKVKRRRRRSALKEIPLLLGAAALIALVLKTFLVQAFVIPSGSMEQTIRIGDRVLVDKLTPWFGGKPERGDVVVFKDPGGWLGDEPVRPPDDPVVIKQVKQALGWIGLVPSADEQDLIKRVVAVGGDTVKCCDADGRVTVNGTPLNEPYVNPGNQPSELTFEVKVPQGRLWVMGDHRKNSADSRYHRTGGHDGTVSEESVVGRALFIAWPFDHWRRLDEPDTYASVPDPPGAPGATAAQDAAVPVTAASHRVSSADHNGLIPLPTPAELPLVMGVVGLRRMWGRQRYGLRSGCGGFGGRRTIRSRWPRRAPRAPGRAAVGRGRPGARPRAAQRGHRTHGRRWW